MNLVTLFLLATSNPDFITETVKRWDGMGVEVDVVSVECGEANAAYYPSERVVVMCSELYAQPALARFILNHEMGHAWMHQHGVPDSERGADELAVLASDIDEAYAAAAFFIETARPHSPSDPHQSDMDRAGSYMCLADGVYDRAGASTACRIYADSVMENWARIAAMANA